MAKGIERKMSSFGGDSSAAETVANIEELLTQILASLPPRSVARFKCVSKHWLSHISKPDFFRHYTLQNSKMSAFFSKKTEDKSFKCIPLGDHEIPSGWNPFKTLNNSVHDGSSLRIIQSCNGLFLCAFQGKHHPVYVVNPTTNRFLALSSPRAKKVDVDQFIVFVRYGLAFDPAKSPYYKVVCVSNHRDEKYHHIDIYSSETRKWKKLDKIPFFPSPSDKYVHYDCGKKRPMHLDRRSEEGAVYCNGAIHWIRRGREEKSLPWCSLSDIGFRFPYIVHRYFGESGGHLYLIEIYNLCNTLFEVMEMETDYSGWFVKYHVDLDPVFAALPDSNSFVVLCLRLEKEEDTAVEDSSTHVLLHMPGKIISYNLWNKTFKTSVELANKELFLASDDTFSEHYNYPYMETLACV